MTSRPSALIMETNKKPPACAENRRPEREAAALKAITLWQPWATLLAEGLKIYETRSWAARYRGPIAFHAARLPAGRALGKTPPQKRMAMESALFPRTFFQLPTGCILGVGELIDCLPIDEAFAAALPGDERFFGDFSPGRFAWVFREVRTFAAPIPARGWQGLWNWESPLSAAEEGALQAAENGPLS